MKRYLKILLFVLPISMVGQTAGDSIFTQDQFLWFVKKFHPISVSSDLLIETGENTVLKAKGGFDPFLSSNLNQKYYNDVAYYSLFNAGLKIPTWYGIDVKTGFDQNSGTYINPQNVNPNGGLWYAGVSVPIGQGLILNKRRAVLKQSKIFQKSTLAEQKKILNDLAFEAVNQYWIWVEAYNEFQIYEESVELAKNRLEAVKQSYMLGDVPAIDTLEALIQVQNREMNRNKYEVMYKNATLQLSNYLWFENFTPLEISNTLRPPRLTEINLIDPAPLDSMQTVLQNIEGNHPDIALYDFKLQSMEIERKLKIEGLKPVLNVNYNALNEPVGMDFTQGMDISNYKWGLEFSIPLFLREQRGDLKLTKLKIRDTELDRGQKVLEVKNKIVQYYNQQYNLKAQVELYTKAVANYAGLLDGERKKFSIGESSLFLVNSREINLIQARITLVQLMTKYQISLAGGQWAIGVLNN